MSLTIGDSAQPSGTSAADDKGAAAGAEADDKTVASRLGLTGTVSQSAESSSSNGSGDSNGELDAEASAAKSDCADCRSSMLVSELSLLVWPGRPNSACTAAIRRCLHAQHFALAGIQGVTLGADKLAQADVTRLNSHEWVTQYWGTTLDCALLQC